MPVAERALRKREVRETRERASHSTTAVVAGSFFLLVGALLNLSDAIASDGEIWFGFPDGVIQFGCFVLGVLAVRRRTLAKARAFLISVVAALIIQVAFHTIRYLVLSSAHKDLCELAGFPSTMCKSWSDRGELMGALMVASVLLCQFGCIFCAWVHFKAMSRAEDLVVAIPGRTRSESDALLTKTPVMISVSFPSSPATINGTFPRHTEPTMNYALTKDDPMRKTDIAFSPPNPSAFV